MYRFVLSYDYLKKNKQKKSVLKPRLSFLHTRKVYCIYGNICRDFIFKSFEFDIPPTVY